MKVKFGEGALLWGALALLLIGGTAATYMSRPAPVLVEPKHSLEIEIPRLDLNAATAEELQGLPGIGPALAARIVERRQEAGPFSSVEELLEIEGIGEATLEGFRDSIIVKG